MLVRSVVDDQLDHHLHIALVGSVQKLLEIVQRAVRGVYVNVVRDVVAIVAQRRRKERQDPEARHAEVLQVIETRDQSGEVSNAVTIGILERPDMQLVDDRVLVPEWVCGAARLLHAYLSPSLIGCNSSARRLAGLTADCMSEQHKQSESDR